MTTATPAFQQNLQRDVQILLALAHLHCATLPQIHALCFPFQVLATAPITLRSLAEGNFLAHSTWQLKRGSRERGQVWVLTSKGHGLLQRYVPSIPPLAPVDLGRPSTAVEHEEWSVRLDVRTLLIRLILKARRTAMLHTLDLHLPWEVSITSLCSAGPRPGPDAVLRIAWHPPERQGAE